jgi:hypothetical protein
VAFDCKDTAAKGLVITFSKEEGHRRAKKEYEEFTRHLDHDSSVHAQAGPALFLPGLARKLLPQLCVGCKAGYHEHISRTLLVDPRPPNIPREKIFCCHRQDAQLSKTAKAGAASFGMAFRKARSKAGLAPTQLQYGQPSYFSPRKPA